MSDIGAFNKFELLSNKTCYKACGYTDDDLDRPIIGIANSYNEMVSGHMDAGNLLKPMAARGEGPGSKMLSQVDSVTDMPTNSSLLSLLFSAVWLLYFYGANLGGGWFGSFDFDSSELPIITLYAMYIPMFIQFMRKERELGAFKRFVMPALGLAGCAFMVYAAFVAHGAEVAHYLIVFAVFMIVGNLLYHPSAKKTKDAA